VCDDIRDVIARDDQRRRLIDASFITLKMRRRRYRRFADFALFLSHHLLSLILAWIFNSSQTINAEPQLSQFRCTGEDLILFCHHGTRIKIYNAIYGRSPARLCLSLPDDPCIRPELEEIGQLCNERSECTIAVTTKSLPQCWPLQSDNLQVEFECVTDAEAGEASAASPDTTPSFIPPLVSGSDAEKQEEEETTPNSNLLSPGSPSGSERETEAEILKEIRPNNILNEETYLDPGVSAEREGFNDASTDMGPIIGGSVAAVIIMVLASVLIALVVCRGHSKRFNKFQFSNESSDAEFGTIKQRESRKKGIGQINYASLDLSASKSTGNIAAISHPRPIKAAGAAQQKHHKNSSNQEQGHHIRDEKTRGARAGDLPPAQSRAARAAAAAVARPKTSSSEASSNGGKSKLEYGSWRVYQKPRDARAIKGSDVYY